MDILIKKSLITKMGTQMERLTIIEVTSVPVGDLSGCPTKIIEPRVQENTFLAVIRILKPKFDPKVVEL